MAASLFESALYRELAGDREIGALFTDTAELRAMLLVEGALAKAQGAAGLIPETAAAAIHRMSMEVQLDPGALAAETGRSGVPVPALVAAFRAEMGAPDHAAWVHYGATSQDIVDTALMLRMRRVLEVFEERMIGLCRALGRLAEEHAELPMAGRTWGQAAVPVSFGGVAAGWGRPVLSLLGELEALRVRVLMVSLSGAAGTLSAMGAKGPEVARGLAEGLGLGVPEGSWHSDRQPVAALAAWMVQVAGALAKMAEDLHLLAQSGIGEVRLGSSGGSSTMPQKQNPVGPAMISALARYAVGLNATLQAAAAHRQQRDGAAWMAEWLALPQLVLAVGRALALAEKLAGTIAPAPEAMAHGLDDGTGLIFAEALSFRLAETMPRPEAQAAVKEMCRQVAPGRGLQDLAAERFPEVDLTGVFEVGASLGQAPAEARAFATAVRALG